MAKRKSARWRAAKARRAQARRVPRSYPVEGGLLNDAPARPTQIALIDGGVRTDPREITPPRRSWFKPMGAPPGEKVHLLEVSPALDPVPVGEGSPCGAIGGRDLGYPWEEREPGDRYCPECVQAQFLAERVGSGGPSS